MSRQTPFKFVDDQAIESEDEEPAVFRPQDEDVDEHGNLAGFIVATSEEDEPQSKRQKR